MKKYGNQELDKPYDPGILDDILFFHTIGKESIVRALFNKHEKQQEKKLLLLCRHYKIKKNNKMYYELSLALAKEYVKGFQLGKQTGRTTKWEFNKGHKLAHDVDNLINSSPHINSVNSAVRILAKQEPWKSIVSSKDSINTDPNPAEALRNAYYDYKKREKNILKYFNRLETTFKKHKL